MKGGPISRMTIDPGDIQQRMSPGKIETMLMIALRLPRVMRAARRLLRAEDLPGGKGPRGSLDRPNLKPVLNLNAVILVAMRFTKRSRPGRRFTDLDRKGIR
jgi:hypothetical protein